MEPLYRNTILSQRDTISSPPKQAGRPELASPQLSAHQPQLECLGDRFRFRMHWIYARRGWSAAQIVPPEVMDAYRELKALGFTQQLLPE